MPQTLGIKEIHLIERIETVKSPKDALELARIKEIHLIERIETTMIYYHFTTAHLRIKEIHLIERIETSLGESFSAPSSLNQRNTSH